MSTIAGAVAGAHAAERRRQKLQEAMKNVFGPDLYKDAQRVLYLLKRESGLSGEIFMMAFTGITMLCFLTMFINLEATYHKGFLNDVFLYLGTFIGNDTVIGVSWIVGLILSVWIPIRVAIYFSHRNARKNKKALQVLIASDPQHWEPIVVLVRLVLDIVD
jgi:hypothetical protein